MIGRSVFIASLLALASAENLRGERELAGSPTKSPSSGLHKPTWKPSSKPNEHSSKSAVKSAGSPSKSPSSGLHKPTWKPSSKPNEKHSTKSEVGAALPRKLEEKLQPPAGVEAKHPAVPVDEDAEVVPTKSPSAGLHKPTWKPSSKPAEHAQPEDGPVLSTQMHDGEKVVRPAHQSDEKDLEGRLGAVEAVKEKEAVAGAKGKAPRQLAGSPTKSPSSGLHKPTWKPSSKPNEHRELAGSPSKSPSSGLHKPTWKPSSKPNERRALSERKEVRKESPKEEAPKESRKEEPKEEARAVSRSKRSNKAADEARSPGSMPPTMSPKTMEPTEGSQGTKPYHTRSLVGSPSKSPSSGLHKPTWKPSSKPNEHRMLSSHTEYHAVSKKSNKGVSEARSPGSMPPTMSPKTMKPTEGAQGTKPYHTRSLVGSPYSKEHRQLSGHHAKREAADEATHEDDPKLTKKEGKKIVEKKAEQLEEMLEEVKASKGTKSSDEEARKAVKDTKSGKGFDSKASSKDAEDADEADARRLHGYTVIPNPTKSPSTGIRKPTWKPSSKPNERRALSDHEEYHAVSKKSNKGVSEARSPGSMPPTMSPKTMKPTEGAQGTKPYHTRSLVGSPYLR